MICPCEEFEERAGIKEDSGIEHNEAEAQARAETCRGCQGKMGLGLFETMEEK